MTTGLVANHEEALAFLDSRIGHGIRPGIQRIRDLLELMTDPQQAYPAIHVAGTNGKTTTVWMIDALLGCHGLRVGSYTSPHLERIEDRYRISGAALEPDEFVTAVADVAPFIEIYEARSGESVTYFEASVAIAFQAFAAAGIDAAVVEVGLGGRYDATNVLDAGVCVITGIALDHTSILGETLGEIAAEKAAIIPPGSVVVTGPLPAAAEGAVTARVAEQNATWHRAGAAFTVRTAARALGGWSASIDGIHGAYEDLFLPLHGRHQVDHLATAIAACEAFFGEALDDEAVRAAVAEMTAPGRIEVVERRPLIILDGSHNVEGLEGLAATLQQEFVEAERTLVVGFRGGRDSAELLAPLAGLFTTVIVTAADDELAVDVDAIAAAAGTVLDADRILTATPVPQAVTEALHLAGEEDIVVVAGSLYVVGEARTRLRSS
jgi:dihydrofolate synthase/folylpolyglutamate synthase